MKELKIRYYQRLFDPIVTLWVFLSQVLDTDKSCHNAVSKVIAYLSGLEVEIPSLLYERLRQRDALRTTDTSAYCQALVLITRNIITKAFSPEWSKLRTKSDIIPELLAAHSTKRLQIYRTSLKVITHKAVPHRPGRSEARVRKRRPKAYPLMTKPRQELRNLLQTAYSTCVSAFLSAIRLSGAIIAVFTRKEKIIEWKLNWTVVIVRSS